MCTCHHQMHEILGRNFCMHQSGLGLAAFILGCPSDRLTSLAIERQLATGLSG